MAGFVILQFIPIARLNEARALRQARYGRPTIVLTPRPDYAKRPTKASWMIPMSEQCGNCRFFKSYGQGGECRRFPPVVKITNGSDCNFSRVREGDWCGEYRKTHRG